jgi:hypothetical protein
VVASFAAGPRPAPAHTRSVSYSSWEFDDRGARVLLRIDQLELTRLPWGIVSPPHLDPRLARYVSDSLRLSAAGEPCVPEGRVRALQAPKERAVLEWRLRCPSLESLVIESRLLLEVAPSHLHFAKLSRPPVEVHEKELPSAAGEQVAPDVTYDLSVTERVLTNAEPRWVLAGSASRAGPQGTSLGAYLVLGVEHIATGYDHLIFLLALLLLATSISEVVTIVTGFTVAHSITLALAALGRVRPEPGAIEALIGLSIALVAAENAWILSGRPRALPIAIAIGLAGMAVVAASGVGAIPPLSMVGLALFVLCYFALERRVARPMRLRSAIAFCFGLIHGFGFAGVLAELELARDRLLPALLGFNLGVEVGQLVIVALVWPLLRWLADLRQGGWHRSLVEVTTAAICAVGLFWLVQRAYG